MAKYKLIKQDNILQGVLNNETLQNIPADEANTDYQEYLQFLADGGVPEPADE
jgi:hypothetical protein